MIPALPATLADRFAAIMAALRGAVAARGADKRGGGLLGSGPALVLLWSRLGRAAARFAALAARAVAGASLRPAPCRAAPRPAASPAARLPRGFGWLLPLVPEAACYGSQLRHLLADPECSALLSAEPALGRVLRPLCRMLGIETRAVELPPALALPRRVAGGEAGRIRPARSRPSAPARPASATERADAHRVPCRLWLISRA